MSWTYDAQGHMTAESQTGTNSYSASYSVDGVGNRTSQTIGTKTTSFTLNSDDQLTATSTSTGGFVNSYTYNNAGDQTNRTLAGTSYTLAYDYEGQLTSSTVGGVATTFAHDALGRRFSSTNGGTTTKFLYNGGKVIQEKQGVNKGDTVQVMPNLLNAATLTKKVHSVVSPRGFRGSDSKSGGELSVSLSSDLRKGNDLIGKLR